MTPSPDSSPSKKPRPWHPGQSLTEQTLTIEPRMPWKWRLIFLAAISVLSGVIAVALFGTINIVTSPAPAQAQTPVPNQVSASAQASSPAGSYAEQIEKLRAERDQFSATVNAAESQLNIERSAQKQLMMQVKALEADKVKLKEELAFFENLLPADIGTQGISIRRLKPEVLAPNKLSYQLLVMQGGKGDKQFVGNLQIVVSVIQGGKPAMITFNDGKAVDGENFKLAFKHYQRIDGTLVLPEGVTMKSIQARILENGQQRTQLSVNL